jgi:hypothetical protein
VLPGVTVAGCVLLIAHKAAAFERALPASIVAGLVVQLLGTWLAWQFFPVVLSKEGLHGHSVWGVRRFMRWQDIAAARPFRVFNLLWLRLYSKDGKDVIWLAMFQSRPAQFKDEVRKLASPDNPLLKHLN